MLAGVMACLKRHKQRRAWLGLYQEALKNFEILEVMSQRNELQAFSLHEWKAVRDNEILQQEVLHSEGYPGHARGIRSSPCPGRGYWPRAPGRWRPAGASLDRYVSQIRAYNQAYGDYESYQKWYAGDLDRKTHENAKILHQKQEICQSLKRDLDGVIKTACQEFQNQLHAKAKT